jgi:hypothetical protein
VAVDVADGDAATKLLVGYGELMITGIDAELTARLFLHPDPVVMPTPSRAPWRRQLGRRAGRARTRRGWADDESVPPFDPLPRAAWELLEQLERLLSRQPVTGRTPDIAPPVVERIGA